MNRQYLPSSNGRFFIAINSIKVVKPTKERGG
jgi:hypothetical protein